MAKFSRDKGNREERALVMHLNELGFKNVRRCFMTQFTKDDRPDVLTEEGSFELKAWRERFDWLYALFESKKTDDILRITHFGEQAAIGYDPREVGKLGYEAIFYKAEALGISEKHANRILKLKELKKKADYLVLKGDRKKRLFLKYWI